ncbi:MAG: EpsG family protein [Prevotella sp.]|nr:EpsG family protein [Prevotella sp.]
MFFSEEYIIVLVILLMGLFFYKTKIFPIAAIVYMAILALFRASSVGTDVETYRELFYYVKTFKFNSSIDMEHWEPGYVCAIVIFKWFSKDYLLFISLIFLPFFLGVLKFIKDSKVNYAFALFVFYTLGFYFLSLNIMRQMMAIGLIMAAFPLLYKKKYVKFAVITIVVSYLFHKSEFLFLFLIPLHYLLSKPNVQMKKRMLYIIILSSFLFFYIGTYILKDVVLSFMSYMPGSERYDVYVIGWGDYMANNGTSIAYTLFSIFLVYVKNGKSHKFETYMFVIAIALYNIFNTFSVYGSRVFIDFFVIAIMLIPQMIFDKETKHRKMFIFISIVFCIGSFLYRYIMNNTGDVNPYIFR